MNIHQRQVCLILLLSYAIIATCKKEKEIPVPDEGEGTQCDQDQNVANACLACSSLPANIRVSLVQCCTYGAAYARCQACVNNGLECKGVIHEIPETASLGYSDDVNSDVYEYSDESSSGEDENGFENQFGTIFGKMGRAGDTRRDKRFGTLFMKHPQIYRRPLFGKRGGANDWRYMPSSVEMDKLLLRQYLDSGSKLDKEALTDVFNYFIKVNQIGRRRDGRQVWDSERILGERKNTDYGAKEKRYGRIFMGQGRLFGRRSNI